MGKKYIVFAAVLLCKLTIIEVANAQHHKDSLFIGPYIVPAIEKNFFKTEGYYNWYPSILKTKDGVYHLFYSRWKKEYGFDGWLTHSEIAHAVARQPTGPWEYKSTVLKGSGYGHWDAVTAHNPKIEFFEGKYYLYYIGTHMNKELRRIQPQTVKAFKPIDSEWAILRKNQRTGVAVADNINGPFKRSQKPIIEPQAPIATITVNPAICRGKDGKYYLIVKGDKPGEKRFIRNQLSLLVIVL